jgi:micrococcal nuclease
MMAKKQSRKSTPLEWVLVGVVSLLLVCMVCGVIGLVVGEPDTQVAEEPSAQPAETEEAEPTATEEVEPTAVPEPTAVSEPPAVPEPTAVPEPPEQAAPDRQAAQVVDVVDGDTLKVLLDGQEETIRLIGVDTPESVHPQKPVECFGREASALAQELAANQAVQLEADPTQDRVDRYGRLLRYVYLPGDTLLNWELIYQGYGFEYTYAVPYAYQAEFQQAERDARANQRGLWAPDACNGERKPADEPAPPPVVEEEQPVQPAGNCDPAYPDTCIPPVSEVGDLSCDEVREQYGCDITVIPPDPHGLDGNNDGVGCEC